MGRVSLVLKEVTCNRPTRVMFREVGTHVQPPEQLDQVAMGWVQVGWVSGLDTPKYQYWFNGMYGIFLWYSLDMVLNSLLIAP